MEATDRTNGRWADRKLLGKAARLHYEYGLTHREIAEVLHLSRVKVTRLLQQARELGVVEIRVRSDASPYEALETALTQRFGLDEAIVVPETDEDRLRASIARAAAGYLQRILRDDMVVAIGLSRTIALLPNFVVDPRPTSARFVSLVGGLSQSAQAVNPYESTERLAQLYGGTGEHLHAPVVVGTGEMARALIRDPAIARTLERAAAADAAFVGLGGMTGHISLVANGDVTPRELEQLRHAGAVGDIAARFFDADGNPVEHELNSRIIGLTLEQLRRIPLRVVASGGREKEVALAAALAASLASVLVTGDETAEHVLARAPRTTPAR
jgi:DNA-binding transcriptional regulator LsrR (DeoR family)